MKQRFIWVGSIILLMAFVSGCDLDPVRYDGSSGGLHLPPGNNNDGDGGLGDDSDLDGGVDTESEETES